MSSNTQIGENAKARDIIFNHLDHSTDTASIESSQRSKSNPREQSVNRKKIGALGAAFDLTRGSSRARGGRVEEVEATKQMRKGLASFEEELRNRRLNPRLRGKPRDRRCRSRSRGPRTPQDASNTSGGRRSHSTTRVIPQTSKAACFDNFCAQVFTNLDEYTPKRKAGDKDNYIEELMPISSGRSPKGTPRSISRDRSRGRYILPDSAVNGELAIIETKQKSRSFDRVDSKTDAMGTKATHHCYTNRNDSPNPFTEIEPMP